MLLKRYRLEISTGSCFLAMQLLLALQRNPNPVIYWSKIASL